MNFINKIFFLGDAKRKIILINPSFQLNIINSIVYFFLLIISAFYAVNWYFFYQLKEKGIAAGIPINNDYFIFIANSSRQLNIFFLITALVSLVVIYYFGLILSHRIAGPLFKIDKTIDEMIKTNKKFKINLRKDDYFQDHALKLNEFVDKIDDIDEIDEIE